VSIHEREDRALRLQRVAELLAEAVTPQEVLDAILTEGVRAAEARAGAIGVLSDDGESVELLAQQGYEGPVMDDWRRFPVAARLPMSQVIRTGAPLFISTLSERNELFPELAEQGRDGSSIAVLPLAVEGRVFGAMALSFADEVEFDLERREMKIALARQASQALARSRLYAKEQALRERMTFLAQASELLSSSLDYNLTLRQLTHLAVPGLADWCAIDMVGEEGEIVRLAVAHQDPEKVRWAYELQERYPPKPDQPHGVPQVLRSGEAEFFAEIPDEVLEEAIGGDDELREIVDQLGLRSTICVPLATRGRTLGALTLIAAETHATYTDADLQLAQELARRAAVAVDNARLYGEAEKGANAAQALAYIADGVVLLDSDRVVRHWNPAAAAITGVDGAHALGKPVDEVVPAWASLTSHVPLSQPGAPGTRPVTVPLVLNGSELWVAVSGVDFGEGTVYALQDVTSEHALEKTRSDFVATASHELRTPLAAVYGAVRTLRRDDIELSEEERTTFLEMIESEALRLSNIVGQILLAGQLDANAVELSVTECNPAEVAAGVIDSASVHAPEGIALSLSADGAAPIMCDENKLRQVLVNLLDNAVKYSPDGGKVGIRLEQSNDRCLIEVSDEGLGIPSSEREKIFEKFYRLDPQQTKGVGGSGLGLYICRELVERMDGELTVESQPGVGSRFTVVLPERA
jgi:signal transduction histidine kinase/GAF domain-containing protein